MNHNTITTHLGRSDSQRQLALRDAVRRMRGGLGLSTRYTRTLVVAVLVTAAAMFFALRVANAGLQPSPLDARKSPIITPVVVVLNCDQTWNPNCATSATSTAGVRLFTYFYIDGRVRGPANRFYPNVCTLFRLSNGTHTARVKAIDANHNSAAVGPYAVIHCERTGPFVTTGLRYFRGTVNINPLVIDRLSGVASMQLLIDAAPATFGPITDVCTTLGLARGWHLVQVIGTNNVGYTSRTARRFFCR